MSKGHARNAGYRSGNNWDTCDRCGFERRVSELEDEWNGLTVCIDTCYENRHPQDFLRVREETIVPGKSGTQDGTEETSDQDAADAMAARRAANPECFTVPPGDNDNGL